MNMLDELERGAAGGRYPHGPDDPRLLDLVTKRAFVLACVLGVSLGCPVHRATRAYSPLESARMRAACAEASAWSVRSASR